MTAGETRRAWTIVALVFLFMLINFADKAIIGLSAVPIMRELHLTNTQFGTLGSVFFLLFSLSGVLVGFAANKIPTKPLLLILALLWGAAQAPMAGTVSFSTLLAARVALGAGEGPAFPLALHAVYKWFDDTRRAVPTSVVASGAAVGAGIVAPGLTAIIVHFSWHAAFATLAIASLFWAALWAILGAEGRVDLVSATAGENTPQPYRTLLLGRTAIGVFIGGFVAYWAITLNVVWLAAYLTKAARYTPTETGWIIVLPSFAQIVMAPTLGAWSERLVQRGVSSRWARGVLGGCCLVAAGVSMALFPLASPVILKIPLIVVAFAAGSVFFTLGSTLIGEISPPVQRGGMLGLTNSIHSLAGIAAPVSMGAIIDVTADGSAGFHKGFLLAGALLVIGGIAVAALANPEAEKAARIGNAVSSPSGSLARPAS